MTAWTPAAPISVYQKYKCWTKKAVTWEGLRVILRAQESLELAFSAEETQYWKSFLADL